LIRIQDRLMPVRKERVVQKLVRRWLLSKSVKKSYFIKSGCYYKRINKLGKGIDLILLWPWLI
jgi:hypothetical protein